jgi:putative transposase
MPATPQLVFDFCQFRPHAFLDRNAPDPEPPGRHPRADMRKAEEVERLWLTQTPLPLINGGTPPKLDQPRLVRILRTPVRAPWANAIAERWIGTVRRELQDRMLILNRRQLDAVLAEYVAHFNAHRPHRTLNQAAPLQPLRLPVSPFQLRVRRRDRLGGLIHEYSQIA